jgi:hypothetical protein
MKTLANPILIAMMMLFFHACAGKGPATGPNDTLIYFTIDVDEMPGTFTKAVVESSDKTFSEGTAWDSEFRQNPKTVVCYASVPNDQPIYLSEIRSDNSGFFTGGKHINYVLTPQESPLKVTPTKAKASIHYAGAYKFHLIENGFFKDNNFALQRCKKCASEIEILRYLEKIGEQPGGLLSDNNYLSKVKARIESLSK